MKVNINGPGHMIKMTAIALYSKNIFKSFFFQNRKTYDFETLLEASVSGALQSLYKS